MISRISAGTLRKGGILVIDGSDITAAGSSTPIELGYAVMRSRIAALSPEVDVC